MDRRIFIGQSAACLLTASCATTEKSKGLTLTALGACADLDRAEGIKAAGGSYLEWNVAKGLIPQEPDNVWQERLPQVKACPLPIKVCNSFIPGSLRSTGPDADLEKLLAYSEVAFRRAQDIGVETIVFGSSGSRKLKDGFPRDKAVDQFTELLKSMAPLARQHGITVVIEPLRTQEDNFINTVVQGAEIVERVDHPNLQLLADFYHMLQNGEDPSDIRKVGHLLKHCHIAEKDGRTAPGVKGEDFTAFFDALDAVGYNGRLSVEGRWSVDQLPRAYEVIRQQSASI